MSKLLKHFEDSGDQIRLSSAEKASMLAEIHRAITLEDVEAHAPLLSPYQRFLMPRVFVVAFGALLMVGGGTTYAAQGALPGNPLYAVKINVNERMEAAFAVTQEAEVEVNERLAERRIEEVKLLALQENLDATTTAKIAENFDYHSSKAVALAKKSVTKDSEAFVARIDHSLTELEALGSPAQMSDTAIAMKAAVDNSATVTEMRAASPEGKKEHGQDKKEMAKENAKRFAEYARAHVQLLRDQTPPDPTENRK
jgi:hypothetical protein